jgi:oligoribonuclease
MADKKPDFIPTKMLWVDLEMTGLDPQNDRIVEAAAIITDWNFNELDVLETGVRQDEDVIRHRFAANPWAAARPQETLELVQTSLDGHPEQEVETKLLFMLDRHFEPGEPVLLAGNSIHMDRRFIQQWWPNLDRRLHYRMLDVSAWKVVMRGKYGVEFPKSEAHRALGDIRESIAELRSYLAKITN